MTLYDELVARGLIAQVTNEEEIKKMINEGKATFYIGFDPTADSLHVGHFMALCLMKRLQMAGNKPIALLGGGTGMIGDPSGKSDMRKMLTPETIQHNIDCFKKQMSRFIDFSDGKAIMVNNADWLMNLNYIDVLREVGACFSVNKMLSFRVFMQISSSTCLYSETIPVSEQVPNNALRCSANHNAICHRPVECQAAFLDLHDQVARDLVDHSHIAAHHKAEFCQMQTHLVLAGDLLNGDGLARLGHRQRHHLSSTPLCHNVSHPAQRSVRFLRSGEVSMPVSQS